MCGTALWHLVAKAHGHEQHTLTAWQGMRIAAPRATWHAAPWHAAPWHAARGSTRHVAGGTDSGQCVRNRSVPDPLPCCHERLYRTSSPAVPDMLTWTCLPYKRVKLKPRTPSHTTTRINVVQVSAAARALVPRPPLRCRSLCAAAGSPDPSPGEGPASPGGHLQVGAGEGAQHGTSACCSCMSGLCVVALNGGWQSCNSPCLCCRAVGGNMLGLLSQALVRLQAGSSGGWTSAWLRVHHAMV